jgi:hypothetical protein
MQNGHGSSRRDAAATADKIPALGDLKITSENDTDETGSVVHLQHEHDHEGNGLEDLSKDLPPHACR